jgi:DNA-directed RNA polymerase sigma subunit (sigma70/sigma32)
MIIDDIQNGQNGNQQAILNLIEKFNPVLKKYARKLETEDAYNDLQLEFLETILYLNCGKLNQQGDGAMVNYLSRSIYHSYVKLLQRLISKKIPAISVDELTDQVLYQNSGFYLDGISTIEIPPDLLTRKEKYILHKIHIMGCSSAEIARTNKMSRQNVNQIKLRAEKKLRNYLIKSGQV